MLRKKPFVSCLILFVAGFCLLCFGLVVKCGFFEIGRAEQKNGCILLQQTTTDTSVTQTNPVEQTPQLQADAATVLSADNAPITTVTLGSVFAENGFEFELLLNSKGAAIEKVTVFRFIPNTSYRR